MTMLLSNWLVVVSGHPPNQLQFNAWQPVEGVVGALQ